MAEDAAASEEDRVSVTVSLSESRRLSATAHRAKYRQPRGAPLFGDRYSVVCPFCLREVIASGAVNHERRCAAEYRNPPDPYNLHAENETHRWHT